MKVQALNALIAIAIKILSEQDLKVLADRFLDVIEEKVKDTTTPWDDRMMLPVCSMIRKAFDIED